MKLKYKPLVLLFIVTFLSSCVNNLDFDQINLDHTPIINAPLVFFEATQNDFGGPSASESKITEDVSFLKV